MTLPGDQFDEQQQTLLITLDMHLTDGKLTIND